MRSEAPVPRASGATRLKTLFSDCLCCPARLFVLELPHLQDSFAEKILQVMPRLSSCNPVELVKILQTTLRQSSLLQLAPPEQVATRVAVIPEHVTANYEYPK